MSAVFGSPAKDYVYERLHANAAAIAQVSDAIFHFAELGMREHRSAGLLADQLEAHGFQVERGISGFPTGFLATYGSGAPVIALHSEYDAVPGNSQRSGVAAKEEIVPGAPGHCEGHNVNAAVLLAAALALRHAMARFGLPGTLKVFGAPAEEQTLARPYYVRDGYFDDVDIAFHDHIRSDFKTEYGLTQSANIAATFTFSGESAHAAVAPWQGRDALDAVVLMDAGMAQFREHMEPTQRAARVIGLGGSQPNIIADRASISWNFRAPLAEGAATLLAAARRMAEGAAIMTRTRVSEEVLTAVWPVRGNRTAAEAIQRNIERIGMPAWSAEEVAFAKSVQRAMGKPEDGLSTEVVALAGPARQSASSNDCGDISWKVPMGRIWFPSNLPHAAFHHWGAGTALASTIAHKGAVAGAIATAASALDFLLEPALVQEAWRTFREEIGGIEYAPLLAPGQQPPLDLNRDIDARFRPQQERHYLQQTPVFHF